MADLDALTAAHAKALSSDSLLALGKALLAETLLVPTSGPTLPGVGAPVVCVETELGGAVPAFTSQARLEAWKPGHQHIAVPGRALIALADRMGQISGVFLDLEGQGRTWIPRNAFKAILAQ